MTVNKKLNALIMCAGLSKRMRPLTNNVAKPMLEVGNKPFLQYIIENLVSQGISEFIITLHYKPESIINYFGNGRKFNCKIEYSYEEELLDSGGSIKNNFEKLKDNFIVCGGSYIVPNLNIKNMYEYHLENGGIGTIAFANEIDNKEIFKFGQGVIDRDGRLVEFYEKPSSFKSQYIHSTYQIYNKSVVDFFNDKKKISLSYDVMQEAIKDSRGVYAFSSPDLRLFCMSTFYEYVKSKKYFEKMR